MRNDPLGVYSDVFVAHRDWKPQSMRVGVQAQSKCLGKVRFGVAAPHGGAKDLADYIPISADLHLAIGEGIRSSPLGNGGTHAWWPWFENLEALEKPLETADWLHELYLLSKGKGAAFIRLVDSLVLIAGIVDRCVREHANKKGIRDAAM